jgi:hypothetical protein
MSMLGVFFPFFIPYGYQVSHPHTFRLGLLLSGNSSQTHPEMCFTNLLGVSPSNQVDNQD